MASEEGIRGSQGQEQLSCDSASTLAIDQSYSEIQQDEKDRDDGDDSDGNSSHPDAFSQNPFQPFDDLPDESRVFTVRAIVVGVLCGALVNISNLYLGLKSGFMASTNVLGSIAGFAALRACAKYFPNVPILGKSFGVRENAIAQTAATASGGLSWVFVSALPAMYQLELLQDPRKDFWKICLLTIVGAFCGLFFAAPFRRFFIETAASELNLVFPSSSATAITIRSMHMTSQRAGPQAQQKLKALSAAFAAAFSLRIGSQYAIGIFWDWHVFTWLKILMRSAAPTLMGIESWGWYIEWTPAFIGTGMLVGLKVAASFLFGSVLAWGIIGPLLVKYGHAWGSPATTDPEWASLISYTELSDGFANADHPSPRYWLLWPGILCMIAVAFAELICQWRSFFKAARTIFRSAQSKYKKYQHQTFRLGNTRSQRSCCSSVLANASEENSISAKIWLPGLLSTFVATCAVMRIGYGMPVLETIIALFFSAFLSFLAVHATGTTDITPMTAVSKASQITLAGVTKGHGWTVTKAQAMNLLGGSLAVIGAGQAADLISDFRVGYLLRTPPRLQFYTQALGSLCACFIAPAAFLLFTTAYPCIITSAASGSTAAASPCPFQAPNVQAWRAVAVAVTATERSSPVPPSSLRFGIAFAGLGAASVPLRYALLWLERYGEERQGRCEQWQRQHQRQHQRWRRCRILPTRLLCLLRTCQPNMMAVAMAFVIPAPAYSLAMAGGAVVAWLWMRAGTAGSKESRREGKSKEGSWDACGHAVAAGLVAGEAIGGVVNAGMALVGISGDVYGTAVGCPAGRC